MNYFCLNCRNNYTRTKEMIENKWWTDNFCCFNCFLEGWLLKNDEAIEKIGKAITTEINKNKTIN